MIRKVEIGWRRGDEEGNIPVEVLYSRRITLGLEIKADGRVCARMPRGIPSQAVMDFIKERQDWIVQKWFLMEEKRRIREQRPLPDYVAHPELEAAYRKRARTQLEARAAYYAGLMGVTYNRIAIRAARTRWGSCSAKGNLNFNWKLALMPEEILDYLVVHELAHRVEMNHSPAFWAVVAEEIPDYKTRREWLRQNGAKF